MKKVWKYGILVLFVALFALSTLCGCSIFGFPPSYNGGSSGGGSSSGSSNGSSSGNSGGSSSSGSGSSSSGGQTEKPAPKPEFVSGSGTENDPYVISEGYQWANVANHLDAHYLLGADLNLGDLEDLKPVGDPTDPFTGTLDGKDHKIHSAEIVCESSVERVGLFGVISGGALRNLKFADSRIVSKKSGENAALAGIAGQVKMGAHIENCHLENITLENDGGYGYDYVGALIGVVSSASKVIYCSAKATLSALTFDNVGGLFGKVEGGTIDACSGVIACTANSNVRVGGICGIIDGGKITNIYTEISFNYLFGGIAHTSKGGYGVEFGLCFNGSGSNSKPLYYNSDISVKDTTSRYFNSTTIESSNDILDSDEWKDNKLWKKGKLHPELVSYEEYLALTAEA